MSRWRDCCVTIRKVQKDTLNQRVLSCYAFSRRPVYLHGRQAEQLSILAALGDFTPFRLPSLTVDAHADLRSADREALPTGR